MSEMHQVEFLTIQNAEEMRLLGQRIMPGVNQDFREILATGLEIREFRLIEKKYILIVTIDFLKIFHQFENITANALKMR